jgi:hypothetical protein
VSDVVDVELGEDEVERQQLYIPLPLEHQLAFHLDPARFKVGRFGRRWGKTREAFIGATVGHGPGSLDRDVRPMYPGILTPTSPGDTKRDVVWIGKNNPQTTQIWLEEILPRFDGIAGIEINQVDKRVAVEGHGTLHVRSAEAIDSVRGIGKLIKGIICDESAHFPFLKAWRDVLRPIAMDNEAWAMIFSTTNGGPDTELDELGQKISPSGFNRLCLEIMSGQRARTDGWVHYHGTARDNPKIKPAEFALTMKEYPVGSISAAQEMEAKLVTGGAGVAFPEWRDELHIVRMEAPRDAVYFGGLDWGYHPHPAVFVLAAAFGDRRIHFRRDRLWRETIPYTVGFEIGELLKAHPGLEWIACDPSMASHTRRASRSWRACSAGSSIAWAIAPRRCIEAPAGAEQRRSRKLLMHGGLAFEETTVAKIWELEGRDPDDLDPLEAELAVVPEWMRPKFSFHPDCRELTTTLPMLPRDPKAREDVDTKANDHPYDAVTYPLSARAQQDLTPAESKWAGVSRDHDPGRDRKSGRRLEPFTAPEPAQPRYRTGYRWSRGRELEDDE